MEKQWIKARDGYSLEVHVFEVRKSIAVVQVIHGMEEHQERYEPLIKFLNKHGFSVVSSDMRGHGSSAKDLGYFKDKKGYLELIEDQKTVTSFIKKHFKDLPIYLLAHSMGTIITRVLLQENSKDYERVVLSGYPNYQIGARFGIIIASIIKLFRGPKYKSKLLSSLSIGSFNKKIKNPKTDCDWISVNEENIKSYLEDPYCGVGFTCSAFNDVFHLIVLMHQVKRYQNVNQKMKLLLLRGVDDPCTGGEKGANDSYQVLVKAGFESMKRIDYPNMRHEILNEKENQKVYQDILHFYQELD